MTTANFQSFNKHCIPKLAADFQRMILLGFYLFELLEYFFFLLLDLLEDLSLATNQPNLNCSKLERTKTQNKTKHNTKILNKLDSRLSKSDKTQKLKVHLSKDVSRQFEATSVGKKPYDNLFP